MSEILPRAKFGSSDRPLVIGGYEIPCYVLDDGRRVLVGRGVAKAIGMRSTSGSRMAEFLGKERLKPFAEAKLALILNNPIRFLTNTGREANGYEAKTLADICYTVIDADKAGALTDRQKRFVVQCEILVRSFAKVGIDALVDEATGYQKQRADEDLQRLLAVYLRDERLAWTKQFPYELWTLIYDRKGWGKPIGSKRTPLIGKIINQYVYEPLPKGVLEELKKRNPITPTTHRRKWKHHQFFSIDIGQPDLRNQVLQVMTLLRASTNWKGFHSLFMRAFKGQLQRELFDEENDKKPKK